RRAARPTEAPISPVPTTAILTEGQPRRPKRPCPGPDPGQALDTAGKDAADRSRAHQLGDAESQIERLARVQARVAERLVAVVELRLEHLLAAAEALRHVLARELEVDAARPGARGAVGGEEALELAHHVVEVARLD